jgi:hypothetical protein
LWRRVDDRQAACRARLQRAPQSPRPSRRAQVPVARRDPDRAPEPSRRTASHCRLARRGCRLWLPLPPAKRTAGRVLGFLAANGWCLFVFLCRVLPGRAERRARVQYVARPGDRVRTRVRRPRCSRTQGRARRMAPLRRCRYIRMAVSHKHFRAVGQLLFSPAPKRFHQMMKALQALRRSTSAKMK